MPRTVTTIRRKKDEDHSDIDTEVKEKAEKEEKEKDLPARDQVSGRITVVAALSRAIMYIREIYKATLLMLHRRGGYRVDGLLESLETKTTPLLFQGAILSPRFINPLRDIIADRYTRQKCPPLRIVASLLVENPSGAMTAIFFAEKKNKQVPKKLIEQFFKALSLLKTAGFNITEIIFVTPAPLSHDSEENRKAIGSGCFVQVFEDEDVLAPPIDYKYANDYRIFTEAETRAFFSSEIGMHSSRMQQIVHTDKALAYLGARRGRVVEMIRKEIVPGSARSTELTYAYIN
jgi:DNA-directed RNA polymerase subunit H (RpoH/RPB5)